MIHDILLNGYFRQKIKAALAAFTFNIFQEFAVSSGGLYYLILDHSTRSLSGNLLPCLLPQEHFAKRRNVGDF
jgi:hypothetical protein